MKVDQDHEPDGFLFVCRTARSQHKRGGNVAVAWDNPRAERTCPADTPMGSCDPKCGDPLCEEDR